MMRYAVIGVSMLLLAVTLTAQSPPTNGEVLQSCRESRVEARGTTHFELLIVQQVETGANH